MRKPVWFAVTEIAVPVQPDRRKKISLRLLLEPIDLEVARRKLLIAIAPRQSTSRTLPRDLRARGIITGQVPRL
jgi:hypothetical protein